tara:strand:+ start:120375 stop:120572 length:198 start_codon:yes stop_codon:yes gene_type:complete
VLKNLYYRFKKVCPKCKNKLGGYWISDYCKPCDRFPFRKWITGEEDLWLIECKMDEQDEIDKAAQ